MHLSYVRSLPLDSWKLESIRRMRASWNDKVVSAFENAGMPFHKLRIKHRYKSNVAKAYREQLARYCKKTKRKNAFVFKLPKYDPESVLVAEREEKNRLDRVFRNKNGESNFERIRRQQQGESLCSLL